MLLSQDILFYGPLGDCPVCGGTLELSGDGYQCQGAYSEWSSCVYSARSPPRKEEPLNIPESIGKTPVDDVMCQTLLYIHNLLYEMGTTV